MSNDCLCSLTVYGDAGEVSAFCDARPLRGKLAAGENDSFMVKPEGYEESGPFGNVLYASVTLPNYEDIEKLSRNNPDLAFSIEGFDLTDRSGAEGRIYKAGETLLAIEFYNADFKAAVKEHKAITGKKRKTLEDCAFDILDERFAATLKAALDLPQPPRF